MSVHETELDGVFKIDLENFHDERGSILNLSDYHPINERYSIDKLTISTKNVLRGLHGDNVNDKLIFCLKGKIKLAIVNFDSSHVQYLKTQVITMSEKSNFAVFIPKNYLNGHYCIAKENFFFYRWTNGYIKPEEQISIKWDSLDLLEKWNLKQEPILSERDKNSKYIKE